MPNPHPIFLGSEIEQPQPEQALFHVLPVPFEKTVSYGGGTALGPEAILQASWQLEVWDGESRPADRGIFTHPPVDCSTSAAQIIETIADTVAGIVRLGKIPVAIGGEHTVTYGVIKGLLAAGSRNFGVVQIDAHADLRDAYQGDPLSHASVMKRIVDCDIPLYQLGIRAFCEEERDTRLEYGVHHCDAKELAANNLREITLPDNFPENVFFTVDIDGLDPSIFPSTGTPVPGGLGWYQTLSLFESVARQRRIIGFDLMEFAPIEGFHAYDYAAAELLYRLMGIVDRTVP